MDNRTRMEHLILIKELKGTVHPKLIPAIQSHVDVRIKMYRI